MLLHKTESRLWVTDVLKVMVLTTRPPHATIFSHLNEEIYKNA